MLSIPEVPATKGLTDQTRDLVKEQPRPRE